MYKIQLEPTWKLGLQVLQGNTKKKPFQKVDLQKYINSHLYVVVYLILFYTKYEFKTNNEKTNYSYKRFYNKL